MTASPAGRKLRAMAAYIRAHGFSPEIGEENGCGCFLRASHDGETHEILLDVIGRDDAGWGDWGATALRRRGWTEGCTDDAAAACEIAADLADAAPRS